MYVRSAIGLTIILAIGHTAAVSQVSEATFRKGVAYEQWSDQERESLARGDAVVRSLEANSKQEIATMGVIRLKDLPPITMQAFRDSLDQKGSGEMRSGRRFSDPPRDADVADLELDKEALEELRECVVSDCGLQLPAHVIERFRKEVDWSSTGAERKASELMREMVLGLVRDYVGRGDAALPTYDNRRKPVDLAATHSSLLASASMVRVFAPEFFEYLKQFPDGELPNVDNEMHWSVLDFGLDPSITISHAVTYTRSDNGADQLFVASKQIYSSRYLDASLTFTILLRVETGGEIETYLVLLDRSRADSLSGPIGRLARGIVRRESKTRIQSLLDKAQLRLLAGGREKQVDLAENADGSLLVNIAKQPLLILVCIAAVTLALGFVWYLKRLR